jgi:hypothetical protein
MNKENAIVREVVDGAAGFGVENRGAPLFTIGECFGWQGVGH